MTTATKIPRREFLQQAHTYKGATDIRGWYASEKLDGIRAFWDGGMSRGIPVGDIPYASKVIVSSGKPKPWLDKLATGLWSRYGNPVWAPDTFLNQLPCCLLDGELWMGRGNWQLTSKTVKRQTPDEKAWEAVRYMIFGSPNPALFFATGHAKSGKNIDLMLDHDEIREWVKSLNPEVIEDLRVVDGNFIHELDFLSRALTDGPAELHKQVKLSDNQEAAERELDELNEAALAAGAEGMVVRNAGEVWRPKRVHHVLKVKPADDMEGTIVGFTSGEETDKGSKLLGKIGAIIVEIGDGLQFNLSGYTHEEREFSCADERDFAAANPGETMPSTFQGKYFTVGEQITFKYREFTEDGYPKEARYFRKRDVSE